MRRKLDPSGDVVDDASVELKSIRERLRKQRARLRGTLESYLRGKDTSKYLQQQVVTDRNGRYVLVVRADSGEAVHLHGYNLEQEIVSGKPVRLPFTANIAGRFELELHPTDTLLAVIEVEP